MNIDNTKFDRALITMKTYNLSYKYLGYSDGKHHFTRNVFPDWITSVVFLARTTSLAKFFGPTQGWHDDPFAIFLNHDGLHIILRSFVTIEMLDD